MQSFEQITASSNKIKLQIRNERQKTNTEFPV